MTEVETLPARPSLEFLKKLAKQQVAASRRQGKTASLAGAQLALARKYGFPSWRKLKAHVELLEQQAARSGATAASDDLPAAFDEAMKAITSRDARSLAQLLAATQGVVNQTGPHPRWGGQPQPLHVAIESDNQQAFALLLNAGANVDGDNRGYDGWSPLMIAIHWKRRGMRDELIRRGAKVDLIAALMLRDDRRVTKLLKDPAALRGPFPNDATPLHFARTLKSARLLLARGVNADVKDKYGKTAAQIWSEAQRPTTGLVRLAASLGSKRLLDIYKAVEQGRLPLVRKLLADGADVNARFPTGSQGTLLHNAAWNGNLSLAKLLVAKGADLHAVDQEHKTTPAHWARVALGIFNRKACDAVAEYLDGLMNVRERPPSVGRRFPAAANGLPFRAMFPKIKLRFDEWQSVRDGLICKQGFYKDSCVLKLQKAVWTNDRMDQVPNQSGIFFSIWVNEKAASSNPVNYNIHALKLRQLKGYSITSRDFADDFRDRFASLQDAWPNVSVDYGPLTLMQGWIEVEADNAEQDILALMERFEQVSPVIDRLLQARRR